MARLTTVLEDKVYYAKGKWPPTTLCAEMEVWEIRDCMTRLAQYENTELSPEQVREMKAKQTPKTVGTYPSQDIFKHCCPTCRTPAISDHEKYCSECGQAIKWEDTP